MKFFTLALMVAVVAVGFTSGYRLVTGRDLFSINAITQSEVAVTDEAITGIEIVTAEIPDTEKPTALPSPEVDPVEEFEPWWAQSNRETELWSGIDNKAISFGTVAPRSYFLVVKPKDGPRLYVFNPITQNYAYIDADAIEPSIEPPEQ